jgi:HD domain
MKSRSTLIKAFKQEVIKSANNPDFIHHPWFVKYHLDIVDQIARELLALYPEADSDLVLVLVWLHDYGKTIDFANQYQTTLTAGREKLSELGFDKEFVNKAIHYIEIMDKKMGLDLNQAPIEVKIVSSADGCSHFVGPFLRLWWWENPEKDFRELMDDNLFKINKDWTRKIVLPEARVAFEKRYKLLLEQSGDLPDIYLT